MNYEPDEMMSVAAARAMKDVTACFVGYRGKNAWISARMAGVKTGMVFVATVIGRVPPQ